MNTYPEIAVIVVTSHGTIKINPKSELPYTFNLPKGMSMTLLNSVTPGVCNFLEKEDAENFINKLKDILNDSEYKKLLIKNPKYFVSSLVNMLKGYDIVMKKGLFKKKKEEGILQDPDELQYIYHDDKSYRVRSYNSEDENIINKEFSRSITENQSSLFDYKILLLNKSDTPDLIKMIKGDNNDDDNDDDNDNDDNKDDDNDNDDNKDDDNKDDDNDDNDNDDDDDDDDEEHEDENITYIYFSEIIDHLKNEGVKHVIFLDLSCSNFVKSPPPNKQSSTTDDYDNEDDDDEEEEPIVNNREVRSIRSNIKKSGLGGKRTLRKTKKRKLTKTKKRALTKSKKRKLRKTKKGALTKSKKRTLRKTK